MSVGASALMHIITFRGAHPNLPSVRKRESVMPTEIAIIITAIVAVFAIYPAALARADHYAHHQPKT
jgi:multisubunit Na+/H+ antiporter MnhC subunit